MKTRNTLSIVAMAVLVLSGCQKEKSFDGIRLIAERFNSNQKVAVNGAAASWVDGEYILINGAEKAIAVDGNVATVSGVDVAEHYYAVYPADIYSNNDGASYTLNIPASYTYAKTGSSQSLATPMVAYASGNELFFKHVTAAVGVQVINYYGFTIEVDSIELISNKYKLNGSVSVTLEASNPSVTADLAASNTEKKVKMVGGSDLRICAGDSTVVQVPVLPVGSDNRFTINVHVHKVDQPAVEKTLTHTQNEGGGSSQATYALDRAKLAYARFTTPGLFSVSASKKVIISQGNLQWGHNTWRFAIKQFDYIGNATNNTTPTANDENWMDLFCWGANGNSIVPNTSESYNNTTNDISKTDADWTYCNISNGGGGAGRWRSLTGGTSGEWTYLMGRTKSYAKGKVNEKYGLILFPDSYIHPNGVTDVVGLNVTGNTGWNGNNYSEEDWVKMEASGAVFLPAEGYRTKGTMQYADTQGDYWTSSCSSATNARQIEFAANTLYFNSSWKTMMKSYGCSVRLVRDVQ